MKLPRPIEKLAGCVWLPRILAKARLLPRGALPSDYEMRFCHPTGVDGLFLTHFGLSREDVIFASTLSDADVVKWFWARADSSVQRVNEWNQIALNLGRPGYPLAERFPVALSTVYKNVNPQKVTTVFEMLEADEKDAS